MKYCTYCGKEYADNVSVCPTDGNVVRAAGEPQRSDPSPEADEQPQVSPVVERRFWERMTFQQFGIVVIRLQAVWFIFYGVLEAAYLPFYLRQSSTVSAYASLYSGDRLRLILLVLRVIAHFALALFLIQRADTVLRWLVKDLILELPKEDKKDAV